MIQKAERIIEAYQKVKPAGCGVIAMVAERRQEKLPWQRNWL